MCPFFFVFSPRFSPVFVFEGVLRGGWLGGRGWCCAPLFDGMLFRARHTLLAAVGGGGGVGNANKNNQEQLSFGKEDI